MYQLQYLSYLMVLTLGKASGFANLINYFKIGGWKKSQLQYAKFYIVFLLIFVYIIFLLSKLTLRNVFKTYNQ